MSRMKNQSRKETTLLIFLEGDLPIVMKKMVYMVVSITNVIVNWELHVVEIFFPAVFVMTMSAITPWIGKSDFATKLNPNIFLVYSWETDWYAFLKVVTWNALLFSFQILADCHSFHGYVCPFILHSISYCVLRWWNFTGMPQKRWCACSAYRCSLWLLCVAPRRATASPWLVISAIFASSSTMMIGMHSSSLNSLNNNF